jgi:hypothetical protein
MPHTHTHTHTHRHTLYVHTRTHTHIHTQVVICSVVRATHTLSLTHTHTVLEQARQLDGRMSEQLISAHLSRHASDGNDLLLMCC